MTDLIQLCYISTAARTAIDVDAILAVSQRNNARDGITGLLAHDGRRFLQALEGPPAAVDTAFARISADPRHRAIVRLSRRAVETRAFGTWAMAANACTPPIGDGADLATTVDALTESMDDANMRATFRGFARIVRAA